MDAAALLKSQGWRGKGFSLHPTNNNIGLAKPLLISRNTDGRGIGQKQHYTSDQWWLNAFDQKLKGLDTSKKGTVVQSVTQGKLDVIASCQPNGKYTGASGLYASFVRGGMLEGTMEVEIRRDESTDATPVSSDDSEDSSSKKREKRTETKAEKKARRAAKQLRKEEKAAKKAAKAKKARKAAEKAAKEVKRARKANETKEERRARKAERRARKEAKRRKREGKESRKPDQG